jgi:proteasome lid subunit RPN8/RPN11
MTIRLKPEQERVIGQAIQAGLIRTADDVVDMGMETLQRRLEAQVASLPSMSLEQWLEEFRTWVHSHPTTTPLLSNEAVSREFIYST